MLLSIGLEYVDAVFTTMKESSIAQYTITGVKVFAVLLFLVNLIKKYSEGAVETSGITWGLTPADLVKNLIVILLVLSSTELLSLFDGLLVSIENQFRETAPALLPLQLKDVDLEQDINFVEAGSRALGMLYEYLVTPFYPMKVVAFILGVFLWLMDLFIYPLFLAERYFLLGLLQVFFPLVISLAVLEKFRDLGYRFFRLYAAVYMIVPAFFLVNVFINLLYEEINANFWTSLTGSNQESGVLAPVIQLGSVGFIFLLKLKLYSRAISFTFRLFAT